MTAKNPTPIYLPLARAERRARLERFATRAMFVALLVAMIVAAALVASVIGRAAIALAADCPPGCTCTCDGGENGWANLETSAPIGGATVTVQTAYTNQHVVLGKMRRLGLPVDAPASPEHLAYFEPASSVRGGGGAPFSGATAYGPIAGRINGFRWYAVSARKDADVCPADAATPLHEYACYWLGRAGSTRIAPTWEDQFGVQTGTFSTNPATVCLPLNGRPGKPFICYGDSDQVGPGPGSVCVDTPVSMPGEIETERYDEFCAVLL